MPQPQQVRLIDHSMCSPTSRSSVGSRRLRVVRARGSADMYGGAMDYAAAYAAAAAAANASTSSASTSTRGS